MIRKYLTKNRRFLILLSVLMSISTLTLQPLHAQEIRGSILGQITDSSGAAVPGAKVTVTNEETNTRVGTQSNEDGNYNVPFLLPGRYTVTIEADGFKKTVRNKVIVQVQDKIT